MHKLRPNVEGIANGRKNWAHSPKGCVANGQMTRPATKWVVPPPPLPYSSPYTTTIFMYITGAFYSRQISLPHKKGLNDSPTQID